VVAGLHLAERGHPRTPGAFHPPRLWRVSLLATAPVLVGALLGGLGVVSPRVAVVVTLALLVPAAIAVAAVWRDLERARALADRLVAGHTRGEVAPLAAWRAEELTSRRTRRRLRRCAAALRRESECCLDPGSRLLGTGPIEAVDVTGVRESIALLSALESRLEDPAQPVSPIGILAVDALVVGDRWSPLYFPERSAQLASALARALEALKAT
jgi:hypothetical protein